jgi:hypothetical protein
MAGALVMLSRSTFCGRRSGAGGARQDLVARLPFSISIPPGGEGRRDGKGRFRAEDAEDAETVLLRIQTGAKLQVNRRIGVQAVSSRGVRRSRSRLSRLRP